MGNPRPKKANPPVDIHMMSEMLQTRGFKAIGEVKDRTYGYQDAEGNRIYLDDTGWTSFDSGGTETDFGSDARDLSQYITKLNPLKLDDKDKKFLKSLNIKSHRYKKAVGLQNQGQPNAVCPNCRQPIKEGEMVTYQAGGMEAHAPGMCPNNGQGQETGWQSRLNLPKNYKAPQPQQPTHAPGMINPNVGAPKASLLKKGDMPRYLDEEFRRILEANGYHPEPGAGTDDEEEVWRSPYSDIRVLIGIDEEDDAPFWAEVTEDGNIGLISDDIEELKQLLEAKPEEPALDQPEWTTDEKGEKVPKFKDDDMKFLKDFRMKGSKLPIKVTNVNGKYAGRPPKGFSFVVPLKAAGKVAFHLAKAGLDEFETINFQQDESTMFVFKTEPELHVAEEIVRAEFAEQIGSAKDMWALWAPEVKDPSELPSAEPQGFAQASVKVAAESLESLLRAALTELRQCEEDLDYHSDVADRIELYFADKKPAHPEEGFMRGEKFKPGPKLVKGSEFQKRALDANLATFVGTFVASMLVKWLGDEYSKRWGNLAQQATAKTEEALQQKGVFDLGTLDKYAQDSGKSRSSALLSLVGRSLALAVVMTTGIAAQKLFSGESRAEAQAPAAVSQQQPTEKTDMWVEPMPEPQQQAPAPKPQRPSKEQLKQQQKQRDQQVLDQIREQDKERNPTNIV